MLGNVARMDMSRLPRRMLSSWVKPQLQDQNRVLYSGLDHSVWSLTPVSVSTRGTVRTYFMAPDEPRSNPPTVDTDWEKGPPG